MRYTILEEQPIHARCGPRLPPAHQQDAAAYRTLPERLASLLLAWRDTQNDLIIGASYQMIAEDLETQRETVGVLLRHFWQQGVVRVKHRQIEIVDMRALMAIAHPDECSTRGINP